MGDGLILLLLAEKFCAFGAYELSIGLIKRLNKFNSMRYLFFSPITVFAHQFYGFLFCCTTLLSVLIWTSISDFYRFYDSTLSNRFLILSKWLVSISFRRRFFHYCESFNEIIRFQVVSKWIWVLTICTLLMQFDRIGCERLKWLTADFARWQWE